MQEYLCRTLLIYAARIKGSDAPRFEVGVCAVMLDNFANEIRLRDGLKIISFVKQDDAKMPDLRMQGGG